MLNSYLLEKKFNESNYKIFKLLSNDQCFFIDKRWQAPMSEFLGMLQPLLLGLLWYGGKRMVIIDKTSDLAPSKFISLHGFYFTPYLNLLLN